MQNSNSQELWSFLAREKQEKKFGVTSMAVKPIYKCKENQALY